MVQRVAKRLGDMPFPDNNYTLRDLLIHALFATNGPVTADRRQWYEHTMDIWLEAFAQEAIKALREPTEAMVAAAGRYNHPRDIETWQTMIDEALKE